MATSTAAATSAPTASEPAVTIAPPQPSVAVTTPTPAPTANASATPEPTAEESTPPTASPAPTPTKGPATATLAGTGTKGLDAAITVTSITCQLPVPDGFQIFVLGQFGKNGPGLNMHITPDSVAIFVSTGAGSEFHSRSFTGTGVTGFDAAVGVQIDSPLTEVTASTDNPGGIGKLTSLRGSLDCGNQQPGSSTLVLTGTTPEGEVNGTLDPVRVGCNNSVKYGRNAQAFGVISVGATRVTAIVNVNYLGFTVYLTGPGISHFYSSADTTTSSVTENGAQISGDAATTTATGAPSITIHVEGADLCGTSTSGG
jgi:hypothetical protein